MCNSSILFFLALMLPATLHGQSDIQGSFVHHPEKRFDLQYYSGTSILEFDSIRFHFYTFPVVSTGPISIRNGTYILSDSIITLDIDTSYSISLNSLRLSSLNINCDSSLNGVYHSNNQTISLVQQTGSITNTMNLPYKEFQYSIENTIDKTIGLYGLTSHWLYKCMKEPPPYIKVCSD